MRKSLILLPLAVFMMACEGMCKFDGACWAKRNRANLNKLEIGMDKGQVTAIMGTPYQREAYGQTEWWLYKTNHSAYIPDYERYTPIAFEGGKVIGWGRNIYKDMPQEYDITIDHTIKRE